MVKEILIVDDQPGIRLLLNEVFKKEGYVTHLAPNGVEALKIFDQQHIDCVLLDMKIPGMNGIEILQKLKEKNKDLPVMMMTATVISTYPPSSSDTPIPIAVVMDFGRRVTYSL